MDAPAAALRARGGAQDPRGVSSPLFPFVLRAEHPPRRGQGWGQGGCSPQGISHPRALAGAGVYFPGKREGDISRRVFGGVPSA